MIRDWCKVRVGKKVCCGLRELFVDGMIELK